MEQSMNGEMAPRNPPSNIFPSAVQSLDLHFIACTFAPFQLQTITIKCGWPRGEWGKGTVSR